MAIAGTKRTNWKTTIIGKYFHQEENYKVLGKCKKIWAQKTMVQKKNRAQKPHSLQKKTNNLGFWFYRK